MAHTLTCLGSLSRLQLGEQNKKPIGQRHVRDRLEMRVQRFADGIHDQRTHLHAVVVLVIPICLQMAKTQPPNPSKRRSSIFTFL